MNRKYPSLLQLFCLVVCLLPQAISRPNSLGPGIDIVKRQKWGAEPPKGNTTLVTPVPFVVIHHSSVPAACYTFEECCQAMRSMQYVHQEVNGWADIGYNFAVGSDGFVYEGRGWTNVGAHAPVYNFKSNGIVLIGHWVSEIPPPIQLRSAKQLISEGVALGFITENYDLLGHRQVRDTECPGAALFQEITRWKNFEGSLRYPATDSDSYRWCIGAKCALARR